MAKLTRHEIEVLQLYAQGWAVSEIAQRRGVKTSAISMHLRRAADRLGARTPAQAVAVAVGMGWVRWEMEG